MTDTKVADTKATDTKSAQTNGETKVSKKQARKQQADSKPQRVLRLDEIYNKKDRQTHYVPTAKAKEKPGRAGKNTLVVRRVIGKEGDVLRVEIDLKSVALARIIREYFHNATGTNLNSDPPVATPKEMFFAREHLAELKNAELKKEAPSTPLIDDLEAALSYINEDFRDDMLNFDALAKHNEITFDLLWMLFAPDVPVYMSDYGHLGEQQVFYLQEARYGTQDNGSRYFAMEGKIITHDGEDFGYGSMTRTICQFDGSVKIACLSSFPLKFHPRETKKRQEMIARGKKFISLLQKPTCQDYTLPLAPQIKYMPDGKQHVIKVAVRGRVMLDPVAFKFYAHMNSLNEPWVYTSNKLDNFEHLGEDEYLICASWINGFCLSSKVWARFMVSKLKDTEWNENAFSKLEIDSAHRRIIHGLVRAHQKSESSFEDFVQNKGRGMVGLLSGPPGVGKTLTAEVVAEVTHRPLYQASGGELGMDPDKVDRRLEMILEITRSWGAVLLIDEADVFLAARGKTIAQDTLVSIFLRRIEYFQGVLILTTNRRDEIDTAFESRIHFRVHYPLLDEERRTRVWNSFLKPYGHLLDLSESNIAELAKRPLNGRQIKNITSCAISLSRNENRKYNLKDITELLAVTGR